MVLHRVGGDVALSGHCPREDATGSQACCRILTCRLS